MQIRRAVRAPWDPATVVAIGLVLLVVAMWLGRAAPAIARADGEAVDTHAVDAPLAKLREAWLAEFQLLREPVRRTALDDATYEFVRRPNFPYVDEHYSAAKLKALQVDTVLVVDRNSKPVFWRRPNDPANRGFEDADEFLAQLPPLPPAGERRRPGDPVLEGIATFRGAPMLVTAIAIENARGDGDPRGYLIHGRAIDGAVAARIGAAMPAGIETMPGTDPVLPAQVRQRFEHSLRPLVVADDRRLHGYLPLVDLRGRVLRVYSSSAARPPRSAASVAAARPRASWSVVVGASLALLTLGIGGYWFALAPGRRTRLESREQIERLARALAEEAHGGPLPKHVSIAPEPQQMAVAEALARIGEPPDEANEPEWWRIAAPPNAPAAAAVPVTDAPSIASFGGRDSRDETLAAESPHAIEVERGAAEATPRHEPEEERGEVENYDYSVGDEYHEWLVGAEEPAADAPADLRVAESVGGPVDDVTIEQASAGTDDAADFNLVRALLDAGRLHVLYQPQLDTERGEIVALEALIRWRDEAGVVREIGELLGADVAVDALADATEFVLRRACADRRDWSRQFGRQLAIGVNVGLGELRSPGFVDRVLHVLADAETPAECIELEVPETALARTDSVEWQALDRAWRRGLSIAIGGYFASDAPLRSLMHAPVAKLKIHRSLIADLPDDAHARAVVDAVLAIGRTLGITVCAEGVEAAAQAEHLEECGCPLVQGWHYAPPLEAAQVATLLRRSGIDTARLPLMSVEQLEAHARTAGLA